MIQTWFAGFSQMVNAVLNGIFANPDLAAFFGGVPLIVFFVFMLAVWIVNEFYSTKDDGSD